MGANSDAYLLLPVMNLALPHVEGFEAGFVLLPPYFMVSQKQKII